MEIVNSVADHFSPENAQILGLQLLYILVIIAITWLVAKVVKWATAKLVGRIPLLQRAGGDGAAVGESIGKIVSLVVWLIGIILVLGQLQLTDLMAPVQGLLDSFFNAVPSLVKAGIVFFVGIVIARIVRQIVETTLSAANLDGWAKKAGLANITGDDDDTGSLSALIATVIFVLIAIPVAVQALDVLGIDAISVPAKNVLQTILGALPLLVGAALLLGIAYFIARWVSGLLSQILGSLGFDKSVQAIGIFPTSVKASTIVSNIAMIAIMLFAAIEATRMLQFKALSILLNDVVSLGGKVLFGVVIVAIGAALARLVSGVLASTDSGSGVAGTIVHYAIIFLFAAMGLKYMGIADSIVNTAFGAIMIGAAVAGALAFGLGGREAAAKLLSGIQKPAPAKPAAKPRVAAKK
ncbi:MAG: hypothetical protein RL367_1959 [Pseudomonadota bacterium]